MSSASAIATRDSVYYFKFVVFRVGSTLFGVPRNGFEVPGTTFEDMFSLPNAAEGGPPEGSSDDNPIVLPVDEGHFRGFLGALYPSAGQKMSSDDWIGALDLATMWRFNEIRAKAISALDDWVSAIDAKNAVLFAKKYRVASWLKASYGRLLQEFPLSIDKLTSYPSLDWETIARLFYIKQDPLSQQQKQFDYDCDMCDSCVIRGKVCRCYRSPQVEDVFRVELESMDEP